jgi:hypothetical protein
MLGESPVVLDEIERRRHVEDLRNRRVAETAACELGNVAVDSRVRIELAFGDQRRRDRAEERLRDGERDVVPLGLQRAEVTLVDDAAAMQHYDAVRVVRDERVGPRHRLSAAHRHESHGIEVRALLAREQIDGTQAPRDRDRRHELAPVRPTPPRKRYDCRRSCGSSCRPAAASRPSSRA